MDRAATGNKARLARYPAKHRRIEFFPSPDVMEIIDRHKAQGLDNCLAGVIDKLIRLGIKTITGSGGR